jgi:WD40 repeat protein
LRHVGPLNQASWNKDGSRVLTASWDGTARIWDAQTGQEIFGVQHDGPVNQAMWNQDASQILTASDDGTARVWDVDKEQELFVLQHEAAIIQASWNSDSSRILTVSRYGTTQVWDADTGQESFILQDEGEVNLAKWNKDGNRILTVSRDGVARVWNADTGQESFVLRHVGEVNKINGNEDGSQILTDIVTQASWNKGDYNSCRRDVETGQVDDIVHPICQQALEMILELDDSERVYTYCRSSVEIGLAEEFIQPVCQQAVELTIDEQNAMTSQQLCLTLETNDMTGSAEKVCELAASRTTEIQSGETVSGTIQPGADYLWSFSGQEEQVVRIAMDEISGGLDPYLILLGPDGEVLVENDDSGGDLNARIYYLLPEDGTYLIVAKGYGDSAGEYALSLVVETL